MIFHSVEGFQRYQICWGLENIWKVTKLGEKTQKIKKLYFESFFVTFKNSVYEFILILFLRKFLYMGCTELCFNCFSSN